MKLQELEKVIRMVVNLISINHNFETEVCLKEDELMIKYLSTKFPDLAIYELHELYDEIKGDYNVLRECGEQDDCSTKHHNPNGRQRLNNYQKAVLEHW